MPVLTSNSRGSSQTSNVTWTNATNAYDGTYGTTTNTYATYTTGTSGTYYIQVGGYNFNTISLSDVNTVTISYRWLVTTASRWTNLVVQPYLGTTAISTATTITTLVTTGTTQTITLTDITAAQLRDSTFGIRLSFTRPTGSSDTASVDFADVSVNYSIENWNSLYI